MEEFAEKGDVSRVAVFMDGQEQRRCEECDDSDSIGISLDQIGTARSNIAPRQYSRRAWS